MNPIYIRLPRDAKKRGDIYPTRDQDYLVPDILEVELPGGIFIDVGWWPRRDPSGSFVVSAFRATWENQLCPQYFTMDYWDAADKVADLAGRYSGKTFIPPKPAP